MTLEAMMSRMYLLYGLLVIGAMGTAQYQGWRLTPVNETRTVPKSVRDNPGSYRPAYGGFRHFTGGK
jgi:hypothetical protein